MRCDVLPRAPLSETRQARLIHLSALSQGPAPVSRAPVHLALTDSEAVDLFLDQAGAPGLCGFYRLEGTFDPGRKRRQFTALRHGKSGNASRETSLELTPRQYSSWVSTPLADGTARPAPIQVGRARALQAVCMTAPIPSVTSIEALCAPDRFRLSVRSTVSITGDGHLTSGRPNLYYGIGSAGASLCYLSRTLTAQGWA